MDNKIEIFRIANSGDENESKLWHGSEISYKIFWPFLIYMTINIISKKFFSSNWNEFVPVVTYVLLLLTISIAVLKHRKLSGGQFKLFKDEIVEIIKIMLAAHSVYFLCIGLQDDKSVALTMLAMNISLYLGFSISLDKLLGVSNKKEILECFMDVFPKKRFRWIMLLSCILFGITGLYFEKIIIPVIVFVLVGSLILLLWLECFRKAPFDLMCEKLASQYRGKKILILHTGTNQAFLNMIKKKIEGCEEVGSLDDNKNRYDCVVVLYTFYDDNKKVMILDIIRNVLNTDGVVVDVFVGKNKMRNRFRAWLGVPIYWSEFSSADEYSKIYYM